MIAHVHCAKRQKTTIADPLGAYCIYYHYSFEGKDYSYLFCINCVPSEQRSAFNLQMMQSGDGVYVPAVSDGVPLYPKSRSQVQWANEELAAMVSS